MKHEIRVLKKGCNMNRENFFYRILALSLAVLCSPTDTVCAANPSQQGGSYVGPVLAGSAAAIAAGLGTQTGRYYTGKAVRAVEQAKTNLAAGVRRGLSRVREALPSLSISTAAKQREIGLRTTDFKAALYKDNIEGPKGAKSLAQAGPIDVNGFVDLANQETMLHQVAKTGSSNQLNLLLDLRADTNAKNKDGNTPLHLLVSRRLSNLPMLNALLERGGVAVNMQNNEGQTPLHLAAAVGNKDIVDALVKKGANHKIKDYAGKTAADYALEHNHPDVMLGLSSRSFVSELLGLQPAEFFATVMAGNIAAVD
jgi:hypothetical protein